MSESAATEKFEELLKRVSFCLADLGFLRKKNYFREFRGKDCALLEFQKSLKSTKNCILFTINASFVCGNLIGDNENIKQASSARAHLRVRPGFFLKNHQDVWWRVDDQTQMSELQTEILDFCLEMAIPYIRGFFNKNALKELWISGSSPGLTKHQRLMYLGELEAVLPI